MNQLLIIIKNTWDEYLQYRLNFILWRFRVILQLIVVYFLWWAIFSVKQEIFGYNQLTILTYILATSIVSGLVYSTKTQEIGADINQGNLSNLLLKPINPFFYWFSRDLGDKFLNIAFSIMEIFILIILLRPPLIFQTNIITWGLTIIALLISTSLYFFISLIISFFGFWTPDVWGPRFLFFVVIQFVAGGLFPLDILPKTIFHLLEFSPFAYLLFFPIKIYLGQLTFFLIIKGFFIALVWLGILAYLSRKIYFRGLLTYGAYGR